MSPVIHPEDIRVQEDRHIKKFQPLDYNQTKRLKHLCIFKIKSNLQEALTNLLNRICLCNSGFGITPNSEL